MKMKIKQIIPLFLLCLGILSCDDDKVDYTTTISSFDFITGDFDIALQGITTDTVLLEWTPAKAADETVVFYRVYFSIEENGFDSPDYELLPGQLGSEPFVKMTDSILNVISEDIGFKQLTTNNLYWKVRASNGISDNYISSAHRRIGITRPAGFASLPETLYLTGPATPAGEEINQAIPFKRVNLGVDSAAYELIVPLNKGNFTMISFKNNKVRYFTINDKTLEESDDSMESPANGIYRVGTNFDHISGEFVQVNQVQLIVVRNGLEDDLITTLNYTGDYTWEAEFSALLSDGSALPNGSQYKFRFSETTVSSKENQYSYWGNFSETASPPTSATGKDYYYVTRVESGTNNYFRFPLNVSGIKMKVRLILDPENENFTHEMIQMNP